MAPTRTSCTASRLAVRCWESTRTRARRARRSERASAGRATAKCVSSTSESAAPPPPLPTPTRGTVRVALTSRPSVVVTSMCASSSRARDVGTPLMVRCGVRTRRASAPGRRACQSTTHEAASAYASLRSTTRAGTSTSPHTRSTGAGPGRVEKGKVTDPSSSAAYSTPPHRMTAGGAPAAPSHRRPPSSNTSTATPLPLGRLAHRRSPRRMTARLARPPPTSSTM
mmetsp:Transcript_26814/g.72318  ORF Transcript_26814/g.72318 Transcript_26814/m.72318 type:complete len:226 (-) Transcript_26814:1748-2425(-)